MGSSSVHFPDGLLDALDVAAREDGLSRNRFVVEACKAALASRKKSWPEGFFASDHLTPEELAELRATADDFAESVHRIRVSKAEAPF